MSIKYHICIHDVFPILKRLHRAGLRGTEYDRPILLGTRYLNGDRYDTLYRRIHERFGETAPPSFLRSFATVEELQSSDKPYFSKWSRDSEIEFFGTAARFCWAPIRPPRAEDYMRMGRRQGISPRQLDRDAIFEYWNAALDDAIRIDAESWSDMSWHQLKEDLFGNNRTMEPSRYVGGTLLLR